MKKDEKKASVFEQNILAISGPKYDEMREELENISIKNFNYILADDMLKTNIKDIEGTLLYKDPLLELSEKLNNFEKAYSRYPCLFFYGIGTAIFYKALLQNKTHKHIVVYEPEIELIYLAFNLVDLSEYLGNTRLVIIHTKDYDYFKALSVFSLEDMLRFGRTYELHIDSSYYDKKYEEDIKKINKQNLEILKQRSLMQGNDPLDSIQGISQFVYNLPKFLNHPSYNIYYKKRYKRAKSVVVVATGPSLTKQLPLLRKYQDNIVIFCVDASFPILMREKIRPDYVISFERVKYSAVFFKDYYKDLEKGVQFIATSISHPDTLANLDKYKRDYFLVTRHDNFSLSYKLSFYNYTIAGGLGVTQMSCELALVLGLENLILIGQDLAYAKDGQTHARGHAFEEKVEDKGNFLECTAYGGKGKVKTNFIWNLFNTMCFELANRYKEKTRMINSTEGGARIEGFEELSFEKALLECAPKAINKKFPKITKYKKSLNEELMLDAYKQTKKIMRQNDYLLKKSKTISNKISAFIKGSQKYTIDELIQGLDAFKKLFDDKKYSSTISVLAPSIAQNERMLTPLYASFIEKDEDKQNKLVAWLYSHEAFLLDIKEQLAFQKEVFKLSIIPLRKELERRKLL